ncbi:MAG: ribokinase [Coriobacteriaceae bacterium]|nr:ribokinase [Coriobacteriaceae bacterium]
MKVLSFGSLNIDYVYSVDHMVQPGETLAANSRNVFAGGKGLNQSVALARAGAYVWHAGLVGPEGDMLLDVCRESGVNTDFVDRTDCATGHTFIQVDRAGQNSILLYGGANQQVDSVYVDHVLEHFEEGDYLILQNEISCLPYIVEKAFERGLVIVLNPSPYNEALSKVDMSKISIFLLNEIEGSQISGGSTDPDQICSRMAELYPHSQMVLTLGSDGSIYQYKDRKYKQRIYKVKTVDTTAAGDTFTGYFIWGLVSGSTISAALDMASRAAAISVSRSGAVPSIPTMAEVKACDFE